MPYLPSRKFIIVFLAILLIGGGMFLSSRVNDSGNETVKYEENNALAEFFKKNIKDSDEDGLKDWEEALWKTDPDNPDTDGDGTLDGEEIKAGRNPVKAGPDDDLGARLPSGSKAPKSTEETGDLTQTDILSREFFAAFLSLQQSGNLNDETKEKLAQSFWESAMQGEISDKYSLSDLNLTDDNSVLALKKYGNELARIIKKYAAMTNEDELTIIVRALKNEDEKELQKLDLIIKLYKGGAEELLSLKTPKNISEYHLNVINTANNLAESLVIIKQIFRDPVKAMSGLKQYNEWLEESFDALENVGAHFIARKVFFSENEDGHIFMNQ